METSLMFKSAVKKKEFDCTIESAIRGDLSSQSFNSGNCVFSVMDSIMSACRMCKIEDPKFIMKVQYESGSYSVTYDLNIELLAKIMNDSISAHSCEDVCLYVVSSTKNDMLKLKLTEL